MCRPFLLNQYTFLSGKLQPAFSRFVKDPLVALCCLWCLCSLVSEFLSFFYIKICLYQEKNMTVVIHSFDHLILPFDYGLSVFNFPRSSVFLGLYCLTHSPFQVSNLLKTNNRKHLVWLDRTELYSLYSVFEHYVCVISLPNTTLITNPKIYC